MISIPKQAKQKVTAKHQRHFAKTILPTVTRVARQAFSQLDPEAKDEATAEVVAAVFTMYVALVRDGRESLAYPSVLAQYGVRRVRVGRKSATPMNCKDISSAYCQLRKSVTVERLDRFLTY